MLAWGQSLKDLGRGSLAGIRLFKHPPASHRAFRAGGSRQGQGLGCGALVTPAQSDPPGVPPIASCPSVARAVPFLLILHQFCHVSVSG